MTPNHKVAGRFRTSGHKEFGDIELVEAREAREAYEMLQPTAWWQGKPTGYSLAQLEVIGYYLSEGWKPSANVIRIAQKDEEKAQKGNVKERIERALCSSGVVYEYHRGMFVVRREGSEWLFDFVEAHNLYGSAHKHIPRKLLEGTEEEIESLFTAYMDGDGWIAGRGWQTETSSSQLHENLIELGVKLGYHVKDMGSRKRWVNRSVVYRSSYSTGNIRIDRRNWEEVDFEGVVWCPTVENGTWLARNTETGHIFWTGNSSNDALRMWDEMTPIPTVPNSLRFIATYAGFENESDLLWDLYLKGVGEDEHERGQGKLIPGLEDLPCWSNGRLFVYWEHDNKMPWQTQEYLDGQLADLRPSAYLRLHENRWVTTHEAFIPIEWWQYAEQFFERDAYIWKEHPFRTFPVIVGVDAAPKRDSTAVVGVTYDPKRGKVVQLFHKIWTPVEGELFDLQATVEQYLIDVYNKFNVVSIVYDPTQLHQIMVRLALKGFPVKEYTQSAGNMTKASQALFDVLQGRNFETYPDEECAQHIKMCVAQNVGNGFRIVKEKGRRKTLRSKIDFAVALAMAVKEAIDVGTTGGDEVIYLESAYKPSNRPDPEQRKLPFALQD